ncbi:hypothetical protein Tco_0892248 [Tanacetum coccineum]|uniref:Myb/SANT-like domain-containing protein n=1 Tax=Tanacetum coccineum TaxID=301880 RepID=A0ABQ5C5B8_9ASTR
MDNVRPRTSSFSPSTKSSTTRTPLRPQRPKKIMKSIWVKKASTIGSQAVLPQNVVMLLLEMILKIKPHGKGTIKTSCIDFEKVSYVEELKFNLLSVSQICDKKHNIFGWEDLLTSVQKKGYCWDTLLAQIGKGPDWMLDLELLTPSINYIPVRKENYGDSEGKVSTYADVEDLDEQHFIVHGTSIHAAPNTHSEERTADKEVPLSSEDQALHDELVSLMHQESIAKIHNDAQRNTFKEEKRRITLEKGKESANHTSL